MRIRKQYGNRAILVQGEGHGETKIISGAHGCQSMLLDKIGSEPGEYTVQARQPDSWEGWYWGAKHVWGCETHGQQNPQDNIIWDVSKNSDAVLFWGADPETTPWGWGGLQPSRICFWFTEIGVKQIHIDACPQGSIYFNEDSNIAQKCTGCAHLLDNGWEVPRCVDVCAHDAILFKDEGEFGDLLANAKLYEPVANCGSRVYYLNLPKRFVAGSAVDLVAREVLIGAVVTLANTAGIVATITTDELGDFAFNQVAPDTYTVTIEAAGYAPLQVPADLREIDLSLGDLGLARV